MLILIPNLWALYDERSLNYNLKIADALKSSKNVSNSCFLNINVKKINYHNINHCKKLHKISPNIFQNQQPFDVVFPFWTSAFVYFLSGKIYITRAKICSQQKCFLDLYVAAISLTLGHASVIHHQSAIDVSRTMVYTIFTLQTGCTSAYYLGVLFIYKWRINERKKIHRKNHSFKIQTYL